MASDDELFEAIECPRKLEVYISTILKSRFAQNISFNWFGSAWIHCHLFCDCCCNFENIYTEGPFKLHSRSREIDSLARG